MNRRSVPILVFLLLMLVSWACGGQAPASRPSSPPTSQPPLIDLPSEVSTPTTSITSTILQDAIDKALNEAEAPPDTASQPLMGAPNISQDEAFIRYVFDKVNEVYLTMYPQTYYAPAFAYIDQPGEFDAGGCGLSDPKNGPFYCSVNEAVYMVATDLWSHGLVSEDGDFSLAYAVAHEIAHHFQNISNIRAAAYNEDNNFGTKNQRSVLMELQADCLAGVWTNTEYYKGNLTSADLAAAIEFSSDLGDENSILSESDFQHGYGKDRTGWFLHGYNTGKPEQCNPFQVGTTAPVDTTTTTTTTTTGSSPTDSEAIIKSFFQEANNDFCAPVDDGSSDTVFTLRCPYNDNFEVDFDLWSSDTAIDTYVKGLRAEGYLTYDDVWNAKSSGNSGYLVAFKLSDGSDVLFWNAWGKSLSGTAVLKNGELQSILDWWQETGVMHYE